MDAKNRKKLFLGLGGILWFLAVLLAYAYTHKPFSAEQVFILGKSLWQIIVVIGVLSFAGGLGLKVLPEIGGEPPLTLLAIQAGLGLGVLGMLILGMGVSIGFSLQNFTIFILGGLFFFHRQSIAWWKQWSALLWVWRKSSSLEKILSMGILFILFTSFAESLVPPLAFDSLVYHLTLPKFYLIEGGISYTEDLMYWGMPQIMEMLNVLVMALAGVEAAILLGWSFGLLTLVGLLGFLENHFSSLAAWIALVALLAGNSLSSSLSWGYVEGLLMLFTFSVFVILSVWVSHKRVRYLITSALLTGFAIGTKYTAAILPFAFSPVFFIIDQERSFKRRVQDIVFYGAIALLAFLLG